MSVTLQLGNGSPTRQTSLLPAPEVHTPTPVETSPPDVATPPAAPATKPAAEFTAEEEVFLNEVIDLWQRHEDHGLATRLRIGRAFNEKYGPPTERQARGQQILKAAALKMKVSESEISRMRSFAHHFPSLDELKRQHPDVTTWTKLKELLPRLKAADANGPEAGSKAEATKKAAAPAQPVARIERSLKNVAAVVRQAEGEWDAPAKEKLKQAIAELSKAMEERLHLRLNVTRVRHTAEPHGQDEANAA